MNKDIEIMLMIILVAFIFVALYALIQIIREVKRTNLMLNECKLILNEFADELLDEFEETSWIPFPENTPISRGWYICTIRYGTGYNQTYVMEFILG